MKQCKSCKQILETTLFNKRSSAKDGLQVWCKKCQKEKFNEYRKANPDLVNAKWRRYYYNHQDRMIQRKKDYEQRIGIEKVIDRRSQYAKKIKRFEKYGITESIYLALREEQKQKCAMCDKDFGDKMVHIDHCHQTNRVRGILCVSCI